MKLYCLSVLPILSGVIAADTVSSNFPSDLGSWSALVTGPGLGVMSIYLAFRWMQSEQQRTEQRLEAKDAAWQVKLDGSCTRPPPATTRPSAAGATTTTRPRPPW